MKKPMCIVKLGGCNGSGKTTVIRTLFNRFKFEPVYPEDQGRRRKPRPEAYRARQVRINDDLTFNNVYVLGSYESVCGGMDTISDKDDRIALIRKYAKPGNLVICEGFVFGKTYGEVGRISEEPAMRGRWVYAFMGTSYEECVRRVLQRRAAAGNTKPFDPEKTMRRSFRAAESTARIAADAGQFVVKIGVEKGSKPERALQDLLTAVAVSCSKKSQ